MSRIRYLEFRPGRWVKLVDGKVVGPATAAEVDAWKREQAEQAAIWENVVKRASTGSQPPQLAAEAVEGQSSQPLSAPKPAASPVVKPSAEVASVSPAPTSSPPGMLLTVEDVRAARQAVATSVQRLPEALTRAEPPQEEFGVEDNLVQAQELPPASEAQVGAVAESEEVQPEPARAVAPSYEMAQPEPVPEVMAALPEVQAEPEPQATAALAEEAEVEATFAEEVAEPEPAAMLAPVKKTVEPEAEEERDVEEAVKEKGVRARRGSLAAQRRPVKGKLAASKPVEGEDQLYLWFMVAPTDDLVSAVRAALAKYAERFHQPAGAVLCHAQDLATLEKAGLAVDVRQGKGVLPRNFWIGPK